MFDSEVVEDGSAFEFRALEAVLIHETQALYHRLRVLGAGCAAVLETMSEPKNATPCNLRSSGVGHRLDFIHSAF